MRNKIWHYHIRVETRDHLHEPKTQKNENLKDKRKKGKEKKALEW